MTDGSPRLKIDYATSRATICIGQDCVDKGEFELWHANEQKHARLRVSPFLGIGWIPRHLSRLASCICLPGRLQTSKADTTPTRVRIRSSRKKMDQFFGLKNAPQPRSIATVM